MVDPAYSRAQRALDGLEQRLAALQDLHVDTSQLSAQVSAARDLIRSNRYDDSEALCTELQGLADQVARGGDRQATDAGARQASGRYYQQEQVAEQVRTLLEQGLLEKVLAEREQRETPLAAGQRQALVEAVVSGVREELGDALQPLSHLGRIEQLLQRQAEESSAGRQAIQDMLQAVATRSHGAPAGSPALAEADGSARFEADTAEPMTAGALRADSSLAADATVDKGAAAVAEDDQSPALSSRHEPTAGTGRRASGQSDGATDDEPANAASETWTGEGSGPAYEATADVAEEAAPVLDQSQAADFQGAKATASQERPTARTMRVAQPLPAAPAEDADPLGADADDESPISPTRRTIRQSLPERSASAAPEKSANHQLDGNTGESSHAEGAESTRHTIRQPQPQPSASATDMVPDQEGASTATPAHNQTAQTTRAPSLDEQLSVEEDSGVFGTGSGSRSGIARSLPDLDQEDHATVWTIRQEADGDRQSDEPTPTLPHDTTDADLFPDVSSIPEQAAEAQGHESAAEDAQSEARTDDPPAGQVPADADDAPAQGVPADERDTDDDPSAAAREFASAEDHEAQRELETQDGDASTWEDKPADADRLEEPRQTASIASDAHAAPVPEDVFGDVESDAQDDDDATEAGSGSMPEIAVSETLLGSNLDIPDESEVASETGTHTVGPVDRRDELPIGGESSYAQPATGFAGERYEPQQSEPGDQDMPLAADEDDRPTDAFTAPADSDDQQDTMVDDLAAAEEQYHDHGFSKQAIEAIPADRAREEDVPSAEFDAESDASGPAHDTGEAHEAGTAGATEMAGEQQALAGSSTGSSSRGQSVPEGSDASSSEAVASSAADPGTRILAGSQRAGGQDFDGLLQREPSRSLPKDPEPSPRSLPATGSYPNDPPPVLEDESRSRADRSAAVADSPANEVAAAEQLPVDEAQLDSLIAEIESQVASGDSVSHEAAPSEPATAQDAAPSLGTLMAQAQAEAERDESGNFEPSESSSGGGTSAEASEAAVDPLTSRNESQARDDMDADRVQELIDERLTRTHGPAALTDEQLASALKRVLPELLANEEIRQHLFATLAMEMVTKPGVLGAISGLRDFVQHEVELAAESMRAEMSEHDGNAG